MNLPSLESTLVIGLTVEGGVALYQRFSAEDVGGDVVLPFPTA